MIMIMAGNQPYFMPYIGYWQLINAADVFIMGDDYNYIERGWVNRNRILENGQVNYFNIEIFHASSNKKTNELYLAEQFDVEKKMTRLSHAYRKAPHFEEGAALMREILSYDEKNVSRFLEHSIASVCNYLDIRTKLMRSSDIPNNTDYKREYRTFDQCRYLGVDTYINAIGGQKLYTYEQFRERGIRLGFLKAGDVQYQQFESEFVPNLSIIDVIMFNSKEEIQQMLQNYTILWEEDAQP